MLQKKEILGNKKYGDWLEMLEDWEKSKTLTKSLVVKNKVPVEA